MRTASRITTLMLFLLSILLVLGILWATEVHVVREIGPLGVSGQGGEYDYFSSDHADECNLFVKIRKHQPAIAIGDVTIEMVADTDYEKQQMQDGKSVLTYQGSFRFQDGKLKKFLFAVRNSIHFSASETGEFLRLPCDQEEFHKQFGPPTRTTREDRKSRFRLPTGFH